jgi:DNA-binding FadR family transcriptional regulator
VKEMSSREILDAIRRGVEESARRAAERKPEHTAGPPPRGQPARSISEMTAQEILEAIDRGLEETSRRIVKDHGERSI